MSGAMFLDSHVYNDALPALLTLTLMEVIQNI